MTEEDIKKQKRLSWDEFFMRMAVTAAARTTCLFVKAGSVFVDTNNRVISVGYNGSTCGDYHCNEVGCAKVHGDPINGELRRCRGAHGEMNAIVNSDNTERLRGSTLYVTALPCWDCMKVLNNAGVKRIVYLQEYARTLEGSDGKKKAVESETRELAIRRGIALEKFLGDLGGLKIAQEDTDLIEYFNKKRKEKFPELVEREEGKQELIKENKDEEKNAKAKRWE